MAQPKPASTVRPQPLIAVKNVFKSARFYAQLLDATLSSEAFASDHAHLYDRVMKGDELILQLHAWDEENHPNLVGADRAPPGHGVLIWFQVDDFDAAVSRARSLGATIVEEPHVKENAQHRQIWLRDADGYLVVLASPDGEASERPEARSPAKDAGGPAQSA